MARMRIEHVAMWTDDIERLARFYRAYFGASVGERYVNPAKGFAAAKRDSVSQTTGLTHLAFAVGSDEGVDELTGRLHRDGYTVLDGPRRTGDGYYESVVADPDGNRVELTA